MLIKIALSVGLLFAGAQAQQAANCVYQELKCGSVLLAAPFCMFSYHRFLGIDQAPTDYYSLYRGPAHCCYQ